MQNPCRGCSVAVFAQLGLWLPTKQPVAAADQAAGRAHLRVRMSH